MKKLAKLEKESKLMEQQMFALALASANKKE